MKNFQMYCISLEPNHLNFIKELGYIPVGLGESEHDYITQLTYLKIFSLSRIQFLRKLRLSMTP